MIKLYFPKIFCISELTEYGIFRGIVVVQNWIGIPKQSINEEVSNFVAYGIFQAQYKKLRLYQHYIYTRHLKSEQKQIELKK